MQNQILKAGQTFPDIKVKTEDGREQALVDVHNKATTAKWTLVTVYRGQHCPICLKYLNELNLFTGRFNALDIELVAVSADDKQQLAQFKDKGLDVSFPVVLELQVEDMKKLGLYISEPTSNAETDHLFAEPALFLVNPKGKITMIEIANAPFIRPDIDRFVSGLEYAMEHNYPTRGTHSY